MLSAGAMKRFPFRLRWRPDFWRGVRVTAVTSAFVCALVAVRKPTIAALPGAAAGAGLAIALACDIRIAAKSAFVSTGYARVGLSGDYGIAWLLTRTVGSARARELMFTAERVDSERAERKCNQQYLKVDRSFLERDLKRLLIHA